MFNGAKEIYILMVEEIVEEAKSSKGRLPKIHRTYIILLQSFVHPLKFTKTIDAPNAWITRQIYM